MADLETIRARLVRLCESKRSRRVIFTSDAPSQWQPRQFTDPRTRQAFTDEGAWTYISRALSDGAAIEEIVLERPPGASAYVLLLPGANSRKLYVKLQICGDHVRGRSFHESEF
ncbi:hypothetical protein [Bradyrhizobium sp. TM233]|uniref:hypothetical protein n=1 Tax=Bradyrhizobium sp. TM233 TaxID=2599801 RepID=UPI0027D732EC|nr:hypothetical protein TM233_50930 [Bradyrhizobium sp. TM233]